MSVFGAGEVASLIKDVVDRAWPDPIQKAEAMLKVQELDNQLAQGQLAVDQAEAANNNLFVAGWRPFVGWVCGIAFAYHLILTPIIQWYFNMKGITYVLPQFDDSLLSTTLEGMLGLGVLRTVEKMSDKAQLLPWQK